MDSCPYSSNFASKKWLFLYLNAISSSLSVVGSCIIVFTILRGGWIKLCRLHNRLLLGISAIDVLYSIALGLSFIPSPRVDDCSFGKGNDITCTTQGFFLILGLAVPGYSTMLSVYYMATIVYSKTEEMLTQKFEPFMHAFAVLPSLICAAIGAKNMYFYSQTAQCWIEDPCLSSKECDGWDGFGKGGWLVIASSLWIYINSSITCLCILNIYRTINGRAKAMRTYEYAASGPPSRMDIAANESAKQGFLYMSAFLFTYSWSAMSILFRTTKQSSAQTTLYILTAVFLPLQGFWNVLTYSRPRFVAIRQKNENLAFLSILKIIIMSEEAPRKKQHRRRGSVAFDPIAQDCILSSMGEARKYAEDNTSPEVLNTDTSVSDKVREVTESADNYAQANILAQTYAHNFNITL